MSIDNSKNLQDRMKELFSDLGELVAYDQVGGEVIYSTEDEVAVLYKPTNQEPFELTHPRSQFIDRKLPNVGDKLVSIGLIYSTPTENSTKSLADVLKEDDDFPGFE